ncbi:glycosyltransferase family 2 protein [Novosphingobium ginsenosidimutans]|uniref:glycosyltransferase family 2 protein n=1 Tax=Novosphingobium ginsenosidimutans TaxID=1176536 RepID=UPI001EE1F2D3|nr:glycosyltransferase family 2 protein [Novosphingobium ginsenosidimutans]
MWLIVGKRVRGRNLLSPLIGSSRQAYPFWVAQREAKTWPATGPATAAVQIVVAIDARHTPELLAQTLKSLSRAGKADAVVVVGGLSEQRLPEDGPQDLRLRWANELSDLYQDLLHRSGAWLVMLNSGDCLAPGALTLVANEVHGAGTIIYGDDDLIDRRGRRYDPHFKPDWNAELFRHHDYLSGAAAVRLESALLGSLPPLGSPDWISALTRKAVDLAANPPRHMHQILVHRHVRPNPAAPPMQRPHIETPPTVTVIIPTRNQLELLKTCLQGLQQSNYPELDCIIIDNGSDDPATIAFLDKLDSPFFRVLRQPGPFNYSALNNAAVAEARGEFLCFLNNDVSMIGPDWLMYLIGQARGERVGAVGARLLYPDGTIQHAGVVLGVGGGAGHAHRGHDPVEPGYFLRASLPQFVSAVTGACMVVQREKFLAVGGFDQDCFPVAFNDVDLCLKLNAQGWQTLYEPRAELVHHESKSRGTDHSGEKKVRFAGELARLKKRWNTDRLVDPYHHPALSRFSEQFVIGL